MLFRSPALAGLFDFWDWGHILCCGEGYLGFRPYGRSPFPNAGVPAQRKGNPKGFAPAYGPLAGARGTFVTGPIRAQRLRFASLHLLPLCTTASYGRCAPTPGSIPSLSLPKGQKIKSQSKSKGKSQSQIKRSQPSAAPTVGSGAGIEKSVGCQDAFASRLAPTKAKARQRSCLRRSRPTQQ